MWYNEICPIRDLECDVSCLGLQLADVWPWVSTTRSLGLHSKTWLILSSPLESPLPLQWPKDAQIIQISEICESRDLDIYHQSSNEKIWLYIYKSTACRVSQNRRPTNRKTSHWEKLETAQSLLPVKAKSWIKSDGSLKKKRKKKGSYKEKSVGQLRTCSFCLLSED